MRTIVIGEYGSNWSNLDDILYSCEALVKMGAIPKGQAWKTELVVNKKRNPAMYETMKKYELPDKWIREIVKRFPQSFFSVFDAKSLDVVYRSGVTRIKVASPDCVFKPLVEDVAKTGKETIMSVGGATLEEIRQAVKPFHWSKLTLMHCVVDYRKHDYMINYFKDRLSGSRLIPWGTSFNYPSKILPAVCVGAGSVATEVHFKINSSLSTPDSGHSFTPIEFQEMVDNIKEVEENMGNSERPSQNEIGNLLLGRRKEDGLR